MAIGKRGRKEFAERRVLLERSDDLVIDLIGIDELSYPLRQLRGNHALVLQRPEALKDDRRGND